LPGTATMRATLISLACGAGLLSFAAPAVANPYDDCILQHMGTAQNEAAVNAIERACIAKTSIAIPREEVGNFESGTNASVGQFNTGYGSLEYGLLVELKNTTKFNITEVVVTVRNKDTNKVTEYPVDTFDAPLPPGALLSKLAEPAYRQIIQSGKTWSFFVRATEVTKSTVVDFGKKFSWGVTPTKGIPIERP
jgi:hypothetical protein